MEAIEATYFDKCDVWRMDNVKQPNGAVKQQRTQIHADVKCALSIGTRPALNTVTDGMYKSNELINQVQTQDKLYLNPSFVIEQGDELIISHMGREITAQAGLPFIYDSHQVLHVQNIRYA